MNYYTSSESLFKPGEAKEYFKVSEPEPIHLNNNNFSVSNAWWLAETSRLIYHPGFYNKNDVDFGCFRFEQLAYIENKETSTHVAILKVIQDSPCIIIVFRGSDEIEDWGINVRVYQNEFNDNGKVHRGFRKAYLSVREELFCKLENNTLPAFITGHSLGAALAILATSEICEKAYFNACYTFGSPRIGNPDFVNSIQTEAIYRIVNNSDVITTIPIDFANIIYQHIGKAILIDENGKLYSDLNEDAVYEHQKSKLEGLKDYALSKLFNNELNTIKNDLPSFLADHSPINYVAALERLLKNT